MAGQQVRGDHNISVTPHFWVGPDTEGRLTPSLPSSLAFLLSVWLGFAPFVLHYRFPASTSVGDLNDMLVALIVGSLALVRMVAPRDLPGLSVIIAALGGWLLAAPFVLDYAEEHMVGAIISNEVVGTGLVALGTMSAVFTYRLRTAERRAY
ncbi:SPW repeat domain-containing protein [Actinokineospora iranica]|uniref:SPW repeat-containing integral membrane domain-containing protein n=1 Tax=Actinokineospora iranica TaxID=1271860 RepID=A0A1G6R4V4_9PSEU|nr:hypothetical protein [Actinokineospora iranica]SDC99578.1 hypothetical protein SAMN05216174_106145 [Actinokineospora iranica]